MVEADGSVILQMLNNSISLTERDSDIPAGRFLQVSGLQYSYRPQSGGAQAELLSALLADGTPIEPEARYKLAITNYMAGSSGYLDNNGDGYTMLNLYSDDVPKTEGVRLLEKTQGKIFESFEQESADVTRKYGGTGLVLAIVKWFTELMGGSIRVESRLGSGSTFTVELPFGQISRRRVPVRYEELKALVADDDRDNCEHIMLLLEKMGVKAEWVDSGYQAVSRVEAALGRGEGFNVCFVDWKMPGLDGMETARRIKSIEGADVDVILITANDSADMEQEAKSAGVSGIIYKPLFESSIADALANIHQRCPGGDSSGSVSLDYDFHGKRFCWLRTIN